MHYKIMFIAAIQLIIATGASGQKLRGKIYSLPSDSLLPGINIVNTGNHLFTQSAQDGSYEIAVGEGDTIIFSSNGYRPDTLQVAYYMLSNSYDITLVPVTGTLSAITIYSYDRFRKDSLQRRSEYGYLLDQKNTLINRKTASKGFGITISPLSYFSATQKAQRKLKKRLKKQEKESFIDSRFSKQFVYRITSLAPSSLKLFMALYRPSYTFCRKSGEDEMILYISEKLKLFRE
ncbi:MAG TPA: hypothetical protein VIQ00_05700, partial [Chitinophagaceae bacterium]